MTSAKLTDHVYALCLQSGDDILASIRQFCQTEGITNAQVIGVGSVHNPTLAHYNPNNRQFTQKPLTGYFEITSLMGNVGLVNDQPAPHLHTTVSGHDMKALAGHLWSGTCGATIELIITAYPSQFEKQLDDTVGLNVWKF